ncbi:preprotein translocase subunit SecA [Lautropia mirabilis ATCC 51599]|jgi:preprotein translocase, secA subunit|uniref:Protein translocase subunit SecA n=1 Tax=Lautropia mirabilis ATCC 51599 TaxID=887898 RepID=E7RYN7_9BURK|nr:preprotein translocase subunit SecA [Lautropia mirabilis]EFV94361.1 preprotein translocase, SecA subunit [Lautropia mirabilis ATCC 51599]VEH00619.1 preprotein translocase subunit SecA [Lautropia mirabilis]
MFQTLLTSIFGSRNSRLLKQYRRRVARINALEPQMEALSDDELRGKTREFQARIQEEVAAGKPVNDVLDAILPEAFAVCREGSKRILGMRHFDVQMLGAMVLNAGKIAEMRTGEGKTLTATLAVYLNALAGRGVHVVTVNDYLAQRDAAWMGRLYNFLGLTVGVIVAQQPSDEKRAAYQADITYGTNNEYGFDYLRDNMVYDAASRMQRKLFYAIVDEVDSILIDEARTPLIISGPAEENAELYVRMNAVPPMLTPMESEPKQGEEDPPGDYWVDHKAHQAYLSEAGHEHAEQILTQLGLLPEGASLYDAANISLVHHLMVALRAHTLFLRDQHYVVQNDEVVIVDEFTGRLMAGRRWSDGLHQAVEAKEGVKIQAENQTLASITFQNYFRMYEKLSGMTGTADTEAYEFQEIYNLETVVVPTHRPMVRNDMQDLVYRTAKEKYDAILADIRDCHERGQPVLVGTTSIENSELVSNLLKKAGLPHNVLNAKQHDREAEIVAQAGRPHQITIATNMAGRGTDIELGGSRSSVINAIEMREDLDPEAKKAEIARFQDEWQKVHEEVLEKGGLHIIGTERHESRRIDNQLRGRAGRQGDKGSSRFYLSMEDPLLKIFAGDRLKAIMDRLKLPEGEAIESGLVSRAIESAQRKVEARNFDIRKQLLDYDDVANEQRKVIYAHRNELLDTADVSEVITNLRQGALEEVFRRHVPEGTVEEQWDINGLEKELQNEWQLPVPVSQWLKENEDLGDEAILARIVEEADKRYHAKIERVGAEAFGNFERSIMLQSIDQHWREHLSALEHLRQGIHLRGYAQKNPKQEYKREAFELFENLLGIIRTEVSRVLMNVQIQSAAEAEQVADQLEDRAEQTAGGARMMHADSSELGGMDEDPEAVALRLQEVASANPAQRPIVNGHHVGRNDPCPCGSGKKYKHCHGKLA